MTAAMQRTPRTGPRPGGSRFMPCRRAAHRSQASPGARLADQKLASGFFAAAPVSRAPEVAAQSLGTHHDSAVFYWGVTPGCVVAPNSTGTNGTGSTPGNGWDPGTVYVLPSITVAPNSAAQDLISNASIPNNSGDTVIIVTPGGNAIPVPPGGTLGSSPNGKWTEVKNANGTPGIRIDDGHTPTGPNDPHNDPRAQGPHAHVPGVTNPDGTPWLPVRPEPAPLLTTNQVVGGVATVGTGYLIDRVVRMTPSVVFPPLWPTIPANAVIP